jgi:hypothetical protein
LRSLIDGDILIPMNEFIRRKKQQGVCRLAPDGRNPSEREFADADAMTTGGVKSIAVGSRIPSDGLSVA